ncbi:MAG: peroxiredoxin-like family protein, partial [Thiohalophilus sp.]
NQGLTTLSDHFARGPVVLSFYRGGWCPFCDLEFKVLHDRLDEIKKAGATLIGIAPETIQNMINTKTEKNIQFELCSDEGNRIAHDYGLVFTVDEAIRPLYLEWGINIPEANGDDSYQLPVPATYIIDRSGKIRAAHIDKDYTKRMEPDAIVAILQTLEE